MSEALAVLLKAQTDIETLKKQAHVRALLDSIAERYAVGGQPLSMNEIADAMGLTVARGGKGTGHSIINKWRSGVRSPADDSLRVLEALSQGLLRLVIGRHPTTKRRVFWMEASKRFAGDVFKAATDLEVPDSNLVATTFVAGCEVWGFDVDVVSKPWADLSEDHPVREFTQGMPLVRAFGVRLRGQKEAEAAWSHVFLNPHGRWTLLLRHGMGSSSEQFAHLHSALGRLWTHMMKASGEL